MLNSKVIVLIFSTLFLSALGQASPLNESTQVVLSLSQDWSAVESQLSVYEKLEGGWVKKLSFPAVLGRNGLGWGVGLHSSYLTKNNVAVATDPVKVEGDGKAPAGVFRLIESFGYQPLEKLGFANTKLPTYTQVDEHSRCVDDASSKFYNSQIYDERKVNKDWDSHEKLRRKDELYKYAVVADHNFVNRVGPKRETANGSCIFLHLWRGAGKGTAGCTAFAEEDMKKLLSLLDKSKNPVLVQLTQESYEKLKSSWKLP